MTKSTMNDNKFIFVGQYHKLRRLKIILNQDILQVKQTGNCPLLCLRGTELKFFGVVEKVSQKQ